MKNDFEIKVCAVLNVMKEDIETIATNGHVSVSDRNFFRGKLVILESLGLIDEDQYNEYISILRNASTG